MGAKTVTFSIARRRPLITVVLLAVEIIGYLNNVVKRLAYFSDRKRLKVLKGRRSSEGNRVFTLH